MAEDDNSKNILDKVLPAILIALIAGGSSPWWWEPLRRLFGNGEVVIKTCDLRKTRITGVHISSEKQQKNDAQAYLNAIRSQNPSPLFIPEQPQLVSKQNNDDGTFPKQNIMVRVFYRTDDCAARLVASLSPSTEAQLDPHYTYQDNNGNRPKEGELEVWYPWKKP